MKTFFLSVWSLVMLLAGPSLEGRTVLEFSWTANNLSAPLVGYGSNVSASGTGITASAGEIGVVGTPGIAVEWTPVGDAGWETYNNWNGRTSVVQLNGSTANIIFTPEPGAAVKVVSVDLDEWAGGGGVRATWRLSGPESGVIASGNWTGNTAGLREMIAINGAGGDGEALTLNVTQTGGDQAYFAIDNVVFDQVAPVAPPARIVSFAADLEYIDGEAFDLYWEIANAGSVVSLTLNDGTEEVDVLALTDLETGLGSITVNPSVATSYVLSLNGTSTSEADVLVGRALSLTKDRVVASGPEYEVTLSWQVLPAGADVTISDGTTTYDVTDDTDAETGFGSRIFTVDAASTVFVVDANASGLTASTRVLREQEASAAFSTNVTSVVQGGGITISWTGAAAGNLDWVGIYRAGDTPEAQLSTQWNYLNGTRTGGAGPVDGSMTFTGLAVGEYYVALLLNDGYEIAQGPLKFSVVAPPPPGPALVKVVSVTAAGGEFTVVWESRAGFEYDIYASPNLDGDPLVDWEQVEMALPAGVDGETSFTEDLGETPPARRFYKVYEYAAAGL